MSHTRRFWLTVLPFLLTACGKVADETRTPRLAEGLAAVEVEAVEGAADREWDGVVEVVRRADLAAQTGGRVREVLVDVEQNVKAGQPLLRITDTEQRAALEAAGAQLKAAEAALAEAERQFERFQALAGSGHVTAAQLDAARAGRDAARAERRAAAARLRQAREQLAYTEVHAPFDAVVERRLVEPGETVAPGTPLLALHAPDAFRVEVELPQGRAETVRADTAATVRLADGREVPAAGLVVFPAADVGSHSVRIRLDLPSLNPPPRPGTTAKVRLATGPAAAAQGRIRIPLSSVLQRGELSAAYVIDEGRLLLRQLRVGARSGDTIEVLSGLQVGERIARDAAAAARRRAAFQAGESGRD
ncbi:MAG: multidrug transporter AcrA [Lysobacteraceae bacterium]|nr:MAG: multidrug transporter AcrA [Xanthomonadaceae bacterium]